MRNALAKHVNVALHHIKELELQHCILNLMLWKKQQANLKLRFLCWR